MADEQPEQILAHREQLKAENDRLNPENDSLKQQVATLTEQLRAANDLSADCRAKVVVEQAGREADRKAAAEATAALQSQVDSLTAELQQQAATFAAQIAEAAKARDIAVVERDAAKTAHDRKVKANSAALKLLLDEATTIA